LNKKSVKDIAGEFGRRFGREPEWLIAAPGRVNLIGEHTDYNDGFVLPMAIERHTLIAAARRDSGTEHSINAVSLNLDDEDEFAVARGRLESSSKWTDYIKGVVAEFLERGLTAESLDLLVSSNVPIGCGLSSSAALQVATARLLQQLDPAVVSNAEIPALCQTAEHKFAGVPVGIMDQFCIANARQNHVVYLDCRTVQAEHIPFDNPDIAVLIVDSRVSRELRSGAYAERRGQCEEACRILGIEKLRDSSEETVEAAREVLGDVCYRRAKHVTSEDARTTEAVARRMHGRADRTGKGDRSYRNLVWRLP
jgi:galactokinase